MTSIEVNCLWEQLTFVLDGKGLNVFKNNTLL